MRFQPWVIRSVNGLRIIASFLMGSMRFALHAYRGNVALSCPSLSTQANGHRGSDGDGVHLSPVDVSGLRSGATALAAT